MTQTVSSGIWDTFPGRLEDARHIIDASAVSRAWLAAANRVKPMRLEMPGSSPPMTPLAAYQTMRWLQTRHAQGCFERLQTLEVYLLDGYFDEDSFAAKITDRFLQSVLTLSCTWPLCTCDFTGAIDVNCAVAAC